MNIEEKYREACIFLESLSSLETPLSYMKERNENDLHAYLERTQELLDALGNPEKEFHIIHVTGTSGKGTTTALIHGLLVNAGYRVGSTFSPATTTTLERIRVNDLHIDPKDFVRFVDKLKPIILDRYLHSKYGKPSYFDMLFAMAMMYFKEQKCDYVVLEVGMGGRYDATNIIKKPLVTVITNVHYDHTHLLGNSLEKIAREKAGIIKEKSHFFTTEKRKEILDIFRDECQAQGAFFHGVDAGDNPNLSLVKAIANFLKIDDRLVPSQLQLPCRFEEIQSRPRIILDGAHNVSKVIFSLKKLQALKYKKLFVIFGAGHTKDVYGMLDEIVYYTNDITFTFSPSLRGKSFSLKEMKSYVDEKYPWVHSNIVLDLRKVVGYVEEKTGEDDLILVIGSLYLAGDIRKKWYPEDFIIKQRKSF